MSSIISSTGSISSAGVGSGLDVNSIVSQLMAIEQRPLTLLQNAAANTQTKISAYGALQSAQSAFRDQAQSLSDPAAWTGRVGSSSDATRVGVTATSAASAGSYSITVDKLATAQSIASLPFLSSTAAVGSGTLHVDLGAWTAGAFTPNAGGTGVDITVTASDTLASLRDKINSAGAGVNASIVNDATGARLVLSSSQTGASNAFRITAADSDMGNTDALGLSSLAYDPAGGTTATTLTQTAINASATINGLSISSASNALTDVVQGITLNLVNTSITPVQVTVAQNSSMSKGAIQTFVAAYNALATLLGADVKYDDATKSAGALQGDSTAVSLQRQLRNMLTASSSASSTFQTLSQAGLQMQQDGTLKIDDTKLTAAMTNMPELQKLFANNDVDGSGAADGIALRMRKYGDQVLGFGGMLTARTDGLTASLKSNSKSQDDMNTRLAGIEANMRAQYTALDTRMATLNALSTYMTQQIANWNKPSN